VERLRWLLAELGRRRMTNVLVEGGGTLLGTLFDAAEIDEVHVFVAPKLVGGQAAPCPLAGEGLPSLGAAQLLEQPESRSLDGDVYISGRIRR
jgi:diaminohydroxyphosphoribosylaminopyrimidine deaminase/5-amino-6-(5-phosphoribosylamino)uracil reductase